MSERAYRLALTIPVPRHRAVSKFVLSLLAWHYNDDEGCAWPSEGKLAAEASLTVRQVRRHLRWLVGVEAIAVTPRRRLNGSITTNAYTLPWLTPELIAADEAARNGAPPADINGTSQGTSTVAPADENGRACGQRCPDLKDTKKDTQKRRERQVPPPAAPASEKRDDDGADEDRAAAQSPAPDGPVGVDGKLKALADRLARKVGAAGGESLESLSPDALEARVSWREAQLAKSRTWTPLGERLAALTPLTVTGDVGGGR